MANDLHFLFKTEDLKVLIAKGAVTIKANSRLEAGLVNNKQVAIMRVDAEGFDANNLSVGRVGGCPCPPCTAKSVDQYK